MLVGGVIEHQVEDDVDVSLMCFAYETVKVLQITKLWVDGVVIRDIITKIDIRRGGNRREPDAVDTKLLQVVEMLDDPSQVTYAIRVGILK